ncbi:putative signal peptide-containing protein [Cryptosporidium canis]|uniref:Signal peptide-containing protein n=1 Tax=Cryptosporidium canis TaxID=195482 RepID=A0A9D5DN08_9CRYT|nr:putative signal peptide-containing protein [Cryptosporidium canis]
MNFIRFGLFLLSFVGIVLGNGDGSITLNDVIPGSPQVVEWSPEEKPDFTYARKVFELVVIRKLTLLHSRGDLPSLSLWAKKMKDSTLVRSADVIQEIFAHLKSNMIDVKLLPLGWEAVLAKSVELKKKMMELDDVKSISRKAVLTAAWEAFDYWITIQDSDLPSSPEEWWDHGPAQLVKQLEAKISFASELNLEGLIEAAKSYSALRLAYGRSKVAQYQNPDELKTLSEESAINLLLRLVIKSCPDILDNVLTSINRMITLRENGKYFKEFGLPYLYDEIGHVRSLLSPPNFGFPYNLESKAGIERFNVHLRIRNANIDKEADIEATDVELLPEQIKLHYILQNSVEAFKFINWSEGDSEYGYMYGLKSNTLFEPVSALWNALVFNKAGEIHPEIASLNKCLLSPEFSATVSDIVFKFEASIEGVSIPPLYNIYNGDYSRIERFIIPSTSSPAQMKSLTGVNDPEDSDGDMDNEKGGIFDRKLLSTYTLEAPISESGLNNADESVTTITTATTTTTTTTTTTITTTTTTTTTTVAPISPKAQTPSGSPSPLTESPLIDTPESDTDLPSPDLSPVDSLNLGMSILPRKDFVDQLQLSPHTNGHHAGVQEDSVLALSHSPQGNDKDSE